MTGDAGRIAIGDAESWALAVSGGLESLAMGASAGSTAFGAESLHVFDGSVTAQIGLDAGSVPASL